MTLLQAICKALGSSDISRLGALDASCQEHDHRTPPLGEIHSVPGTVVDPRLGDALPHSFHISGVPGSQTLDPDLDARSCAEITQFVEPAGERLGLA